MPARMSEPDGQIISPMQSIRMMAANRGTPAHHSLRTVLVKLPSLSYPMAPFITIPGVIGLLTAKVRFDDGAP